MAAVWLTNVTDSTLLFNATAATEGLSALSLDKSYSLISAQATVLIRYVIVCGFNQIVNDVGIICNIVNMLVFLRQGLRRERVNVMLFCLAGVDFCNLVLSLLRCGQCWLELAGDPLGAANWYLLLIPQVLPLTVWTGSLSVSLLTFISLDRCLAVSFPLQVGRYLNLRCSLLFILAAAVVVLAPYAPLLFMYRVVWTQDPLSGRPLATLQFTDLATNQVYLHFRDAMNGILKGFCFLAVAVSCFITIIKLQKAGRVREVMRSGGDNDSNTKGRMTVTDVKITQMLVLIAVVMEICLGLDLSYGTAMMIEPEFYVNRKYHTLFVTCQSFLFLARSLSSSVNFFFYVWLSASFRTTLLSMCGRSRGSNGFFVSKQSEPRSSAPKFDTVVTERDSTPF